MNFYSSLGDLAESREDRPDKGCDLPGDLKLDADLFIRNFFLIRFAYIFTAALGCN